MKHEFSDFVDATYRSEFESGRLKAGYEAALFCIKNGVPVPPWLVELVEDAIKRDFTSGENRGKGNVSPLRQSRRNALSTAIYHEVERLRRRGHTQRHAFAIVADDFWKNVDDGKLWTAEAIKNHYLRVRRKLSSG